MKSIRIYILAPEFPLRKCLFDQLRVQGVGVILRMVKDSTIMCLRIRRLMTPA